MRKDYRTRLTILARSLEPRMARFPLKMAIPFGLEFIESACCGIDTVEPNQPCEGQGQTVDCHRLTMEFVEPLFNDPSLTCKPHMGKGGLPLMDNGRYVATCFVQGKELNRRLIAEGYAVAFERLGGEEYEKAEAAARAGAKGIYRYKFERPIEFRRRGNQNACSIPDDE